MPQRKSLGEVMLEQVLIHSCWSECFPANQSRDHAGTRSSASLPIQKDHVCPYLGLLLECLGRSSRFPPSARRSRSLVGYRPTIRGLLSQGSDQHPGDLNTWMVRESPRSESLGNLSCDPRDRANSTMKADFPGWPLLFTSSSFR